MFLVTDVQEATGKEIATANAGDQVTDREAGAAVTMTGAREEAEAVADDAIKKSFRRSGCIGLIRQIGLATFLKTIPDTSKYFFYFYKNLKGYIIGNNNSM